MSKRSHLIPLLSLLAWFALSAWLPLASPAPGPLTLSNTPALRAAGNEGLPAESSPYSEEECVEEEHLSDLEDEAPLLDDDEAEPDSAAASFLRALSEPVAPLEPRLAPDCQQRGPPARRA